MTTQATLKQATEIVARGTDSRSDIDRTAADNLFALQQEIDLSQSVDQRLPRAFCWWIAEHLGPFQKVLNELKGSPNEVVSYGNAVERGGSLVFDAFDRESIELTPAALRWQGPASTAYRRTVRELERLLEAYQRACVAIGREEIVAAARIGAVRRYIAEQVAFMVVQLIRAACQAATDFLDNPVAVFESFVDWAAKFVLGYVQGVIHLIQLLIADITRLMGQVKGIGDSLDRAASVLEGQGDPGATSDLNPNGKAAKHIGTEPQKDDLILAHLADGLDSDPKKDKDKPRVIDGYHRLTPEQVRAKLGIDPRLLRDDKTGFVAVIFEKDGEYVVAFAGTDFNTREDVGEDAQGGMTVSGQSANAIALAKAINASKIADDVVYTGHSLGGRLASVASMVSGNPAVTFNAAGVSPATVSYLAGVNGISTEHMYAQLATGQVRAHSTSDCMLTYLNERSPVAGMFPDTVGVQIHLGGEPRPISPLDPLGALEQIKAGHGMPNVDMQMRKQFPETFGGTS